MYQKNELPVEEWLAPSSRTSLKEAISRKVSSETKERLFRNSGSNTDYGYSFPGLNIIKQACLKEVRTFFQANGVRARVADIGAGFGNMTWKLLAAGASVDAFEIQKPTAAELSRRLKSLNPYFWEEDDLEDILKVIPENVLSILTHSDFKERYDFIWMSQVLHFLTPDEIERFNVICQHILKPGGKVFVEANCIQTFAAFPNYTSLESAYNRAKKENAKFPGFLTMNSATLINHTLDTVVDGVITTVYTQTEMQKFAIPFQTNAYGTGHVGPADDSMINRFSALIKQSPSHRFSINRFHQVMNLLDGETAKLCFDHEGVECDSFYFHHTSGLRMPPESNDLVGCGLAILLKKAPALTPQFDGSSAENSQCRTSITRLSLFNEQPHSKLLLDAGNAIKDTNKYASFFDAIRDKNYALALRKASAAGNLDLVKIILKYKNSLIININEQSPKNGYTALDWINSNETVEFLTKERIVSLLLKHGAETGLADLAIGEKMNVKTA